MSLKMTAIQAVVDDLWQTGEADAPWVDTYLRTQWCGSQTPCNPVCAVTPCEYQRPLVEELSDLVGLLYAQYASGDLDDMRFVHALARIAQVAAA